MGDGDMAGAEVVAKLIESTFTSVAKGASKRIRDAWDKIFEDFDPFMRATYQKNSFVRILSDRDRDVAFSEIYVSSNFKCGEDTFSDENLVEKIIEGENVVICGNGGAGKTFFMRHAWLSLFTGENALAPIFVELRKLNDLTSFELMSFLRNSISSKKSLSEEVFEYFCEAGEFCIILDGFDEVVESKRDQLQEQILNFAADFSQCPVVVSSRRDQRFSGWSNFSIFNSMPLSLEQVTELIKKVPFEEEARALFLKNLNQSFFEANSKFLSNPLLSIMMLMTFRDTMEVPQKMSIFYDQAFNTLYSLHDSTKAYRREKTLDIVEFQKSFSVFCLLSYYKEFYEFSQSEVIDFIKMSNDLTGVIHAPEKVLKDYEQAVNLLMLDGLKYVFIHRSFQEYFVARALVREVPHKLPECLPVIENRFGDNVLSLCYEMDREKIIADYIKPKFSIFSEADILKRRPNSNFFYFNKFGIHFDGVWFGSKVDNKDSEHSLNLSMYSTGYDGELGREVFRFYDFYDQVTSESNLARQRKFGAMSLYKTLSAADLISFFPEDEISKLIKPNKKDTDELANQPLTVRVSFSSDDYEVTILDAHNLVTADTEAIIAVTKKALDLQRSKLEAAEKNLSSAYKKMHAWAKDEIAYIKDREKSLVDILGS